MRYLFGNNIVPDLETVFSLTSEFQNDKLLTDENVDNQQPLPWMLFLYCFNWALYSFNFSSKHSNLCATSHYVVFLVWTLHVIVFRQIVVLSC